jgi:hypothetical protein
MKKIYSLLLMSLFLINIHAQNFQWALREGLWAYDYGYGIANDASGNIYVAGKFEDNANFSGTILNCQGNHDGYVAKYNNTGTLSWIKSFGGANGDYFHCLAYDGSGNLAVAGEAEWAPAGIIFQGSSITLNPIGDNDVVLAKYDVNGNLLWAKSAGAGSNDRARAVTFDATGNIYVTGMFTDTAYFGSTMITGAGMRDVFVAKYDANGNFQWVRKGGSSGRDEAHGIKCDAAGNVYVCGFYSNNATFDTQTLVAPNNYYEGFVIKYDPSGAQQWVKTFGGSFDDVAWAMTIDNAGKIFIAGEFNASAMFGSTQLITSGNADVFVTCLDQSGNFIWAKRAGGSMIDRARGIGTDGNNLYITGQFGSTAGFDANNLIAADSSDVFIAGMNNGGGFIWASAVGGPPDSLETLGYESGNAVSADAGNVYVTGAILNGGIFGGQVLQPYTRTDMFLTKLNSLVGVAEVPKQNPKNNTLYPNPNNGTFYIDLNKYEEQNAEVTLYNSLGQILEKSSHKTPVLLNVDLSNHRSGVYFAVIKTENETIRQKFVIR